MANEIAPTPISGKQIMDIEPESEIPSKELHQPWIYAYSSSESENISVYYEMMGKWLLFFNNEHKSDATGLTPHDYAWLTIKKMVENGILFRAKCSTAVKGLCEGYGKRHNGVICCYTPNYSDRLEVKRVANAIRRELHCPSNLFYRIDNDSWAGRYTYNDDNNMCIYKHTVKGELYQKDLTDKKRWNLVNL